MISMLPEPMSIKSGSEEFMLFGIRQGEFGELMGLVVDENGQLSIQELIWATYSDWRFDEQKDEWHQIEPQTAVPISTADEEMTQRPFDWVPATDD